ncbi:ABC transporter permease [Kribbella solani]|uniref:ABC transporter permease n=1 Tax=Kribbella solani TaxID=236067 RepID=UPI0029AFB488|nr:ABC transporter permease [Kribbella solani]MDX3002683.1 ABC transporter permease [Kribbella solani]
MSAAISLEAGTTSGRRRRKLPPVSVLLAAAFALVVIVLAIFGSLLAPHDPAAQSLQTGVVGPGGEHLLGTDHLGRDILSRVMAGARDAIVGPALIAVVTTFFSLLFGIISGYRGGIIEAIVMRVGDLMYSVPAILVSIVVVGVLGGGYYLAVGVIILLSVPADTRVVRAAVLSERHLPYIEACRTLGLSRRRIMAVHILPNVMPTAMAILLLDFVYGLIALSSLSYLGLGAEAGSPEWGRMLADNRTLLADNPNAALVPAVLIMATAAAVTLLGDWAYDRVSEEAITHD